MPKFGTKIHKMEGHPVRKNNALYSARYYAKYGQTQEYKDRKRREYVRRKLHRDVLKALNQSETTTARSEICC